ncbi:aspartate kinase, partial [Candidatus Woesearchaeota archaeon]
MKFGGSCLTDGESMMRAANIVRDSSKEAGVVVVVSAMKGVTDDLLRMLETSMRGKSVSEYVEDLMLNHVEVANQAINDPAIKREVEEIIQREVTDLRNVLTAIKHLRESTPRVRDYVASFGERLSTPILWGSIRSMGLNSEWMTGGEAGIITDSNFGEARPLMENCRLKIESRLKPRLNRGVIPVITGFIGEDLNG